MAVGRSIIPYYEYVFESRLGGLEFIRNQPKETRKDWGPSVDMVVDFFLTRKNHRDLTTGGINQIKVSESLPVAVANERTG